MQEKAAVIDAAAQVFPPDRAQSIPWLTLEDLFGFLYYYPLRLACAWVPRRALLALVLPFYKWRFRAQKTRAVERMMTFTGAGIQAESARRIARQAAGRIAACRLDDLLLASPSAKGRIRCAGIDGLENLEHARAAGKGVLLLTVHSYAVRCARWHLAERGYPMLTARLRLGPDMMSSRLGRMFLYPRFMELMQRVFPESVFVQSPDCVLQLVRRLRSGGMVNVLLDGRNFRKGIEGTFLGVPWTFPAGLLDLIRVSGCAVVPMHSRGDGAGFHIRFEDALDIIPAAGADDFAAANLPKLKNAMERFIQRHPEEWTTWMSLR